ncbi:hypothetical protein KCV07_g2376, partial [Aureobasidium melanogenum]
MPTGQTQLRFGPREKALEPGSIKDIRRMLNPATNGTRIRNHRTIAGHMFFEIDDARTVERTGRRAYVRNYLVLGEDLHEAGCVAAMYITDGPKPLAWTTHMRSAKQKLHSSSLNSQKNWQAIQRMIDRYKYLLPARHRRPKPDAVGSMGDDDANDDNRHPGPASDDDYSWRDDLDLLNRPESPDSDLNLNVESEHSQDVVLDDDQDIVDTNDIDDYVHMEDDTINTDQNRFEHYDDRSLSSMFVPHSRDNSPEIITRAFHDAPDDDDIDMDPNPTRVDSDLGDDLVFISQSPKQPKLEPKVEPGPEVTTTNRNAMLRSIDNFVDLTGEPDTEVIDLTGVEDPVVNRSNSSIELRNSSGIELIELED